MTGTRALLLASVLAVAAPAVAAQARNADPYRNQRSDQRGDQRDRRDVETRRGEPRFDFAVNSGLRDGYEAGLRDAQRGDRFDPVREKRYRSGDQGYDRRYGPREFYKDRYRNAFRRGYEDGDRDGRRDDRRTPRWWQFGG